MESKTTKKLIAVVVVAAIAGGAYWLFKPSKKSVSFATRVVAKDTVKTTVTATGSVAPVDKVTVGTQVSGEVKKIYVDFNSHVKKGQLLAELDKSTLNERVKQCSASLQNATSSLNLAQKNYSRIKTLFDQKAATQSELDEMQHSLTQAQSQVIQAQTNMREAQVNLGYAEIYSPIDGVVLGRDVEEGQTVAASFNTPTLFTIAKDLKKMQVEANIDEADIGSVKKGQAVTFTVDSYSDLTFSGEVSQIRLNPTTTNNVVTYTVIISAPNPDEKLYPGMTANISIVTEQVVDLTIPSAAVNWMPSEEVFRALPRPKGKPEGGPMSARDMEREEGIRPANTRNEKTVWIKNGDVIRPRRVQVGLSDGINYIVKSGVNAGDTIITNATVGEKVKGNKGGAGNPFMPQRPKHGSKNSAKEAAGNGGAPAK
ncbi:MAG: efflux RND transporter periplasmic adaptor subunit [Paludibacteraceae bacterium]|nr:efflux RND transporter periplasmic adaptor subunit [Paludibacteraceae bacterium]